MAPGGEASPTKPMSKIKETSNKYNDNAVGAEWLKAKLKEFTDGLQK